MPREFTDCVRKGGKVRTVKPKKDRYLPVCYDKSGSHAGEVKKTKNKGKKK